MNGPATAAAAILAAATLQAAPPNPAADSKGRALAEEIDRRDTGWTDSRSGMVMVLKDRNGGASERRIRMKAREVPGDGDLSLMIFDAPPDLRGSAFLTRAHKKKDDDQWLYLPALKRVKRISSSGKSGSFMGSEFSYEDLSSRELDKYEYARLPDEPCPGPAKLDCFVLESRPRDKGSGYTRVVEWYDKEEYRNLKAEFFDRKKTKLKTLVLDGHEEYLDKFWRPMRMEMVNHQSGKSTTLTWSRYEFRTGLKESDFDRNALKRSR